MEKIKTEMLRGNDGVQIKTRADVIFNFGGMQAHTRLEIYIRSIYILWLMEGCFIEMMEKCSEGAGTLKHRNKTMASIFYTPEISTGRKWVRKRYPLHCCRKNERQSIFFQY